MIRIDNILVIVDPTAQVHPAVDKALQIAKRCNARLELFACETQKSRDDRLAAHVASGSSDAFIINVRALLEPLAEAARREDVDVCIETDSGGPLHARLLDRLHSTHADLVVKDTHHHSLPRRTLLTNTDWELIRGCAAPLLLTRSRPYQFAPAIAAALDPGHANDASGALDRRILDFAQLFAKRLGGSLHLVHAFMPVALAVEAAAGSPALMGFDERVLQELQSARQTAMRALAHSCSPTEPEIHMQTGAATEVLPRVARDIEADIMVMGAISRSGLQRIFIGSTAERVLEHLPCDVLIVKPADFSTM